MSEDEKKNVQVMEFSEDAEENPDVGSTGPDMFKKIIENKLYVVASVVGIVFIIGVLYASGAFTGMVTNSDNLKAGYLTSDDAGQKTLEFVNKYLLKDVTAKLVSTEEESGIYKVSTLINGQSVPIYTTMDGKYIILPQGFIDVEQYKIAFERQNNQQNQGNTGSSIPKSDKPDVDVFVMSYCPYGLQMEKAVIPVMNLLGDKANIVIRFVDYAMHGKKEVDENTRQYCIQKDQSDKYVDYLTCFVQSDDTEKCQTEAGIDKAKLEACIADADNKFNITGLYNDRSTWSGGRFPPFMIDAGLNQRYGVRGSPTFVINGKVISVNRSPEAVKEAICSAFNNPPEECNQTLSSKPTAPGIGAIEDTGSGSGGSCS